MKLFFLSLFNFVLLSYSYGQTSHFFKAKKFICSCGDTVTKTVLISEDFIFDNNKKYLRILIRGLNPEADTIFLTEKDNKLLIQDFSGKSSDAKVFIDFNKEFYDSNFFGLSNIFGVGSYLMKMDSIKDRSYHLSAAFEGFTLNSRIIYRVDFNEKFRVYRFYYFDGKNGLTCR